MAYPLTVAQQIQIGQVSTYLSLTDITKKKFLEGIPYFEQQLSILIALETDILNWQYELNPSDSTLFQAGDYLYALCGRYAIDALNSINAGGVIITPVTGVATFLIQLKNYPQFIVGAIDSPMVDGQDTLVITDPLAVDQSLQGEVEIHVEGAEQGEDLSDRVSFIATYATGQYTIVWNQGLSNGMLVQIKYPIKVTLVSQQTSGTGQGLQAIYIIATVTGNTLIVPQLGTFMFIQVRGATYDTSVITQTGQDLDLTNVGGVTAGESFLIFYYP
jgi:hypothetical protein